MRKIIYLIVTIIVLLFILTIFGPWKEYDFTSPFDFPYGSRVTTQKLPVWIGYTTGLETELQADQRHLKKINKILDEFNKDIQEYSKSGNLQKMELTQYSIQRYKQEKQRTLERIEKAKKAQGTP